MESIGRALYALVIFGIILSFVLLVVTGLSALATTVFLVLAVFFRHTVPVTTSLWGYLICSIIFSVCWQLLHVGYDKEGLR